VDAISGRTFTGRMKSIAPLPDAQSMFMNPDRKVYATKVYLDGDNPELRTGMSCRAEILIERLADATYVPIQAVVRVGGQPTVYVRTDDGFVPRAIQTGLDNSSMIHVVSGLAAGEVVSLAPPLDAGTAAFTAAAPPTAPPMMPASAPAPVASETQVPQQRGEGGPPGGEMSEEERAALRERWQNMTPEERAAERRRRFENLTPEQREEIMHRMRERQAEQGEPQGPGQKP
jgi:HlyD family secretion protein